MFPEAKIEYQYDNPSETHFIKVTPSEVYNDKDFAELDMELNASFEELEVNEELCFITSDSLIQLDSPSRVLMPAPIFKFSSHSNQEDFISNYRNEVIDLSHNESPVIEELASFIFDSGHSEENSNRNLAMAA